ncbi:hypothetical protein [Streptomyces sp. NPDC002884]
MFGARVVPVETAAVVRAAIERMVQDDTVRAEGPWQTLEVLAAQS